MGWAFLFVIVVLVIVFSRAQECYECGSRDPSIYWALKTKALCDSCWLSKEINK